jgi:hypothetical protein
MSNSRKNYKKVNEFYKNNNGYNSHRQFNFYELIDYDDKLADYTIKSEYDIPTTKQTTVFTNKPITDQKTVEELNIKYELTEGNGSSPDVFGPPFWFTLHNGASKYPDNPNKIVQKKMKDFVIAIPIMLPCLKCKDHATSFIESNLEKLDDIVSSKKNLFNFFVDFHNYVNKSYNKKIYTYEEAFELYNGNVKITKMSYS